MEGMMTIVISRVNYWAYIVLMLIGLYGILAKKNYMKKIIGLSILQTAVILFFISIGAKKDATIPIIAYGYDLLSHSTVKASSYINPLPHVLMLTAIVVAVATLGVALALAIRIYMTYGTLEEDELIARTMTHRTEKGGSYCGTGTGRPPGGSPGSTRSSTGV
jgi:multicomponent Na+:H+ antiporter subunit C